MRFLAVTLVSALVALTSAQGLNSLPTCAQTCVGNSLGSTGCQGLDIACICKSNGWIAGLSCCIAKGCSAADQETTIQFADQLCAVAGVTLPSTVSCASSAAPQTSSVPSSNTMMASTTAAVAGISTTGMSSSMTGVLSSAMPSSESMLATTMAASGSTMPASSAATAATSAASAASPVSTAGAAHNIGQGMGVAGAVVAALAML